MQYFGFNVDTVIRADKKGKALYSCELSYINSVLLIPNNFVR